MPPRKSLTVIMLAAGSLAGSVLYRRRSARRLERVELYAEDGSMVVARRRLARRRAPAGARARPDRARRLMAGRLAPPGSPTRSARRRCSRATSCSAPAGAAPTTSTSTASATRPDLLRALGEAIAAAVREHEPDAVRLAAPELGAVPLAAAASLEAGLPFVIVRKEAKEYGTAQPDRGRVRARRARLPGRGRRHLGRRRARGDRGAPRGRPACLHRCLRRRPRGRRRRRARPGGGSAPAALPRLGGRDSAPKAHG